MGQVINTDLKKVRPGNQGAIYTVEMIKKYVPLDGTAFFAQHFLCKKV